MLDVLIQTYNEEANLGQTLESVSGWVSRVFVIDSGSTDGTVAIAERYGATVVQHAFAGYAAQKNWALQNLPLESAWTLILDADEAVTPELRSDIENVVRRDPDSVPENGFYINRVLVFLGRKIWHCGYFPSWNLRLFKRGTARYEERLVHEHMIVPGPTSYLDGLLTHEDHRGLEHFFAKHNRYSTLEAIEIFHNPEPWPGVRAMLTNRTIRRRWGKSRLLTWLPLPWLWRFIYMYVVRGGVLAGRAGWYLSWSISYYEMQVQLKIRELALLKGRAPHAGHALATAEGRLSVALADNDGGLAAAEAAVGAAGRDAPARNGDAAAKPRVGVDPLAPVPTVIWTRRQVRGDRAGLPAEIVPEFTSPWTFRQNVARALWMITATVLFSKSFHNWYGWRRLLLRCFGAKLGRGVRIRPSVNIEIPWNLQIDDGAVVGDHAILYSLGKITIGRHTVVSQYAHLCAGTHDARYRDFPLLRPPITIGADVWIAADSFVGPGVVIGDRTVLGARSSVFTDLPSDVIAVGSPARPLKAREFLAN